MIKKVAGCKTNVWVLRRQRTGRVTMFICLNSFGHEVGDGSGAVQDRDLMEPFGFPCMVEILQFLCSLLNIAEDFDEDVPPFALGLINSAIELLASPIHDQKLLAFVQDELFRNLMHFGLSISPLILSIVCSIVFTLFYHLCHEHKLQIEAFFSCVILRLAQSRYGASYQQQEVPLRLN